MKRAGSRPTSPSCPTCSASNSIAVVGAENWCYVGNKNVFFQQNSYRTTTNADQMVPYDVDAACTQTRR
jgi:hypothetical protein